MSKSSWIKCGFAVVYGALSLVILQQKNAVTPSVFLGNFDALGMGNVLVSALVTFLLYIGLYLVVPFFWAIVFNVVLEAFEMSHNMLWFSQPIKEKPLELIIGATSEEVIFRLFPFALAFGQPALLQALIVISFALLFSLGHMNQRQTVNFIVFAAYQVVIFWFGGLFGAAFSHSSYNIACESRSHRNS